MLNTKDMALLCAVKNNRPANIRAALDDGANLECRDASLYTPLIWAVRKGHTEALQILLEANADPAAASPEKSAQYSAIFTKAATNTTCARLQKHKSLRNYMKRQQPHN